MAKGATLLVCWFVVIVLLGTVGCGGDVTDDIKNSANDAMDKAKDASESWATWVQDKITDGLGLKEEEVKEPVQHMRYQTGYTIGNPKTVGANVVSETKDKVKETASNVLGKVRDTEDRAFGAVGNEGMVSSVLGKVREAENKGFDAAGRAYDSAAQKIGGAYAKGVGAMSGAKENYEEAKDKMSHAVGDLGAKNQKKDGEL